MKYSLCILACFIFIFSGCSLKQPQPEKTISPDAEMFAKAESFYESKTFYRALSEFEKYLKKYPHSPNSADASLRIGEIHLILSNTDAAKDAFEKTIKNYPTNPASYEARVKYLQSCYKEGEYEKLVKKSTEFLSGNIPQNTRFQILKIKGESYLALKDYSSAATAFCDALKEATEQEKADIKANLKKAVSLIDTQNLKTLAYSTKNAALKSYLLFQLGLNYIAEQNFQGAAASFRSFLEEFPDHELAAEATAKLKDIAANDPYSKSTIGCILPLTGKFKIFGAQAQKGIELALASFKAVEGGKQVKFVIKDTGSRDDKAAEAVKELATEGVMAIVGPVGPAEAAVRESQLQGLPIITLTSKDHITSAGDFVFRNFISSQMQAEAAAKFSFENLGARSFSILYPEDEYGKSMTKYFEDNVTKHGGTIYSKASYPPGLTDFTAFIKRIAPKDVNGSDPNSINAKPYDVLFIPDGPKNAGLILGQLNYHNLGNVQVMGTNLWNSPKLSQGAGPAAENVLFPDGFIAKSSRPNVQDFVAKFSGAYGENPGFIEAISYDSAMMLFELISQPDVTSRIDLKNRLHGLKNFPGITGLTSFSENGEANKELYMIKVQNGEFTEYK